MRLMPPGLIAKTFGLIFLVLLLIAGLPKR